MGGKTPETCLAVNKRQDNKLENYCIWLVIYLNYEITSLCVCVCVCVWYERNAIREHPNAIHFSCPHEIIKWPARELRRLEPHRR